MQIVELLLKNGANPNASDKKERKPLHYAAFMGKIWHVISISVDIDFYVL